MSGTVTRIALSVLFAASLPAAKIKITTTSLPSGAVGTAYSQKLDATGGTGTYAWSVSGGALPQGLTLSSAGVLSGVPASAGTASFTAKVTDNQDSDTQPLQIVIS